MQQVTPNYYMGIITVHNPILIDIVYYACTHTHTSPQLKQKVEHKETVRVTGVDTQHVKNL